MLCTSVSKLAMAAKEGESALIIAESRFVKDRGMFKELNKLKLEYSVPILIVFPLSKQFSPDYQLHYKGGVEYLVEPIPRDFLVEKMRRYLRDYAARKNWNQESNRSSQLEAQKSMVEEKLEQSQNLIMLGKLASGVAHDFNNVLAGILGYAEMAKFKFGKSNSSLEKYTESIIAFSKRAGDLTKEILSFSRGTKNKRQAINIHTLLTEVQDLLSHSIDKRYQIKKELHASSAVIVGDSGLIQNAIINIALNARDAMPNGGEIRFATHNIDMDKKSVNSLKFKISSGSYLNLSITDYGTGMDDALIEKIFQPFFTTKEIGKGTGLGLSSVLNTMLKHDGTVLVNSAVGRGTTFELLFPLGRPDEIEGKDSSDTKFLKGFGHLLIIDDEEALREIISGMLVDYGYKVSTAADGVEALEYYKKNYHSVDLVVIDMNLPRCTGHECFQEMKKINPKVKAILSTGFSLNEEAEKILEDGVHGFIQKPFEIKQLLKLISEVI
ncbi:response regulator [Fibrobacterota bacterium]